MSCDRFGDMLVDLVYDEVDAAQRAEVEAHVAECAACQAELNQLQVARSALLAVRRDEPAGLPIDLPSRSVPVRRWLRAGTGIAAAVLIAVIVWLVHDMGSGRVQAAAPPIEIVRTGVSLTILSTPEKWPGAGSRVQQNGRTVQYGGWPGLALVRDQRIVRHLPVGQSRVSFTDVPSGIWPNSVRLRSIEPPEALQILEQNYQHDLASASAVLKRYVDKPITVTFKDGAAATGVLLSFDGQTLVLQPAGDGPRNLARTDVRSIAFAKLPEGLLTRPTLVWELGNVADARQQQFEVAYLSEGLQWRADYVLKLRPAQGPGRREAASGKEIFDTADLVGYATVTNNSGVTFDNAQLKLMAGDVNLIKPIVIKPMEMGGVRFNFPVRLGDVQFQEKAFFEYHLYTLGRPTTIRNAETKQIELVSGSGIKLKRGYVYDSTVHPTAARVVSEFVNSEENGLGKPLPKGVIRLYAPDPTGEQTYVAQTTIDHTAVREKIRLLWGYAFDIVCSYRQTEHRRSGPDHAEKCEYNLRNHKDYDITITVVARVDNSAYKAQCNYPWHVREVGVVEIDVPVKANSQTIVKFSHRYNRTSGGGLASPYDELQEPQPAEGDQP